MLKSRLSKIKFPKINQETLMLILKITVVAMATIAFFFNDLNLTFSDAIRSETTSYILLVPIIFLYMIYRKRKMLRAVIPQSSSQPPKKLKHIPLIAGILLLATSILFYWNTSFTFTPVEYHMAVLPVFVSGLILIFFNPDTLRQVIFPIIILLFLTPPPSEILYTAGATLSSLSSEISYSIIQLAGIPSTLTSEYQSPLITITRANGMQIDFQVDVACSGIYSLMAFFIFAVLLVYIVHARPLKKVAIVLTGIPIVFLLNVLRITSILAIGYNFGETLALDVFHLFGGWVLVFIGTLLLLIVAEKVFKTAIFENKTKKCPACNLPTKPKDFCFTCGRILNPARLLSHRKDIIKIVAIIAIVAVFLSIQEPVFAITESPVDILVNQPSGQITTSGIFPTTSNYLPEFAYRDTEFEELSGQDLSLAYVFFPRTATAQQLWVSLEIASTRDALHRWETCLINYPLSRGWKPNVLQIELFDKQLTDNPPIIGRYFIYEDAGTSQINSVLYWYESAVFNIGSTSEQRHIKISVIGYPNTIEDIELFKEQQFDLAKSIIEYWKPVQLWSAVTMIVSKNGGYLATATTLTLIATIVYGVKEQINQRKKTRKVRNKLSKLNQEIIDAIIEAEKAKNPTLSGIATAYEEETANAIDLDSLVQILNELEQEGMIKKKIQNNRDTPMQTWKA